MASTSRSATRPGFFAVLNGMGDDNGELVAAKPRQEFLRAQPRPHPFSDGGQQQIAGGVAVEIVDRLEAIKVEHHQADGDALALAARMGAVQFGKQRPPVVKAGQRIVVGEFMGARLGDLADRDFALQFPPASDREVQHAERAQHAGKQHRVDFEFGVVADVIEEGRAGLRLFDQLVDGKHRSGDQNGIAVARLKTAPRRPGVAPALAGTGGDGTN